MRRLAITGILVAIAAAGASVARAQAPLPTGLERVRLIQDRSRQELSKTEYLKLPSTDETQLDVGGWMTFTFLDFRDDDHAKATPDLIERLLLADYRAYAKVAHRKGHKFYGRLRNLDFKFFTAPGVVPPTTQSQEGVEVDLAYIDLVLDSDRKGMARLGRQFVRAGRGLTLSAELDGAALEYTGSAWKARMLYGRTLQRDPDIDSSIQGFDRGFGRRDFYIAEGEYRMSSGTRYYAYLLSERDQSRTLSLAQSRLDFHYDADYVGLGTEGRFDPLLHYYLEIVKQSGETLVDIAGGPRVSIDAAGAVAGLLYYPRWKYRPFLSMEYGFGTGDPERRSVTNVFGGKRTITSDTNFLPFGVYDGGLALSPRLSNLHVLRLGYQTKPLPRGDRILPDLLFGTKLSYYMKEEKDGVVSDPLASLAAHDVGFGADFFVGARPFSDLSLLVQYGRFVPGKAYPDPVSDSTNRVLATSTLSF
jgi:hypothetical protein